MKTFINYLLLITSTDFYYCCLVFSTSCYYASIYYAARQIKNIQLAYLYMAYIFFLAFIIAPLVGFSIDYFFDNYYFPLKENIAYSENNLDNLIINNELTKVDSSNVACGKPEKPQNNLLKWLGFWYIVAWIWVQI